MKSEKNHKKSSSDKSETVSCFQTSETLAAEFSEYVTMKTPSSSASVEDDTDLVMDEDYKNKVS